MIGALDGRSGGGRCVVTGGTGTLSRAVVAAAAAVGLRRDNRTSGAGLATATDVQERVTGGR